MAMVSRLFICIFSSFFLGLLFPVFASAAPVITITNIPSEFSIGQQFEVTATASALMPSSTYRIKFRLGTASEYNKGQTLNSGVWLSDTRSWDDFPQITSDADGIWQGTVTARAGDSAVPGSNQAFIRLHLSDNYDSSPVAVNVLPAPTSTPTPAPTPTNTPSPSNTPVPTHTPVPTSTPTPYPTPTRAPTVTPRLVVDLAGPTSSPFEFTTQVLGDTSNSLTPTPADSLKGEVPPPSVSTPAIVMIVLGVLGLGISGFLLIFRRPQPEV